jgi:crossover junction endodeoxyribonuclease RuvC
MVYLGIDPGIAITGYGVVREEEDGGLIVVDYGVIKTLQRLTLPERLHELYHKLTEILFLYRPASGAVEKLFFQKNVRTAMNVGQARGVALLAFGEAGIPVAEYTPLEIKQAVTGYGGADKSQIQQMVRTLLVLDQAPQPDDAADALAVAICHIHSRKMKSL